MSDVDQDDNDESFLFRHASEFYLLIGVLGLVLDGFGVEAGSLVGLSLGALYMSANGWYVP